MKSYGNEKVRVRGILMKTTKDGASGDPRAYLFRQEQPARTPIQEWIPASMVAHKSTQKTTKGDLEVTLTIPLWLAEEKNLVVLND